MRLYAGMSTEFVRETTHNRIADRLAGAFFGYYRFKPSPSEVNSWRNSLRAMSLIVQDAKLDDQGVILEYQLPQSSRRLDCMLCGRAENGKDQAIIVELKQWESCAPSDAKRLVTSWVGGGMRELLHPAVQVGQYRQYLEDTHSAFHEGDGDVVLEACSYLHNYNVRAGDALLDSKFDAEIAQHPLFDAASSEKLSAFLSGRLRAGDGGRILQKIESGSYKPSRKLMEHLSGAIQSYSPWVLLDEQLIVYEKVRALVAKGLVDSRKRVIIVKGGPGTGKSVLAINLVGDLMRDQVNVQHATGSKAFTETIWEILGNRSRARFRYFNNYMSAKPDELSVLVCDEAHRVRKSSNTRFTRTDQRSTRPQVEELITAAKTSVFFIDDQQVVRPDEAGSIDHIAEHARRLGCEITHFELEVQFRCGGSDGFVNWVDNTLGIRKTANVLWSGDERFDVRIVKSVDELDHLIKGHASAGASARLVGGYCWPWSQPDTAGRLIDDVTIGDWRRPWNARPDARVLAKGIPRAPLWAYSTGGLDQVGCVYTAQGFEFDYVGVIWGTDLVYRFDQAGWVGDKAQSHDASVKRSGERFVDLLKNTYRVLLSRGLKGCYVYFIDKETERYVRSRMELADAPSQPALAVPASKDESHLPFEIVELSAAEPLVNCVPLVDLKIAAGYFGGSGAFDPSECAWVRLPEHFRAQPGMFVAQVIGESMNRRISNGAWCLFKAAPAGSRQGNIVVAQHRSIQDPELGGTFTIKRYRSEKQSLADGSWRHTRITLSPESTESRYRAIELDEAAAAEVRIVAELVAVLQ